MSACRRKPIERRVYESARKMCGSQCSFEIGLSKLLKITGARTELKRFRMAKTDLRRVSYCEPRGTFFRQCRARVTWQTGAGVVGGR